MAQSEVAAGLSVIFLGTLNNLLGRIKAKPLGSYNTFASLANSVAYITAYATVLLWTRGKRILTEAECEFLIGQSESHIDPRQLTSDEESTPRRSPQGRWKLIACIGACDAVGSVMGLAAQAVISGPLYSLSLQSIVLFSALIGYAFLGSRYTCLQIASIGIVILGASVSVLGGHALPMRPVTAGLYSWGAPPNIPLSPPRSSFALMSGLSTLPTAASFAIREFLMKDFGVTQRKKSELNIFVLGLLCSLASSAFLPGVLFAQRILTQSHDHQVVRDVVDGARCLAGFTSAQAETCADWSCCTYAPLAYSAYITVNILFNFSLLYLVRVSTALLTFLCVKAVLPLSLIIYAVVKLPLLSTEDASLTPANIGGLVLVMTGLCLYHYARH